MRFPERIALALLFGLGVWLITTAVRIEVLNAKAGYYLPRREDDVGKWRISRDNTPRDQLRGIIQTIGLLQYVLAPVLIALSVVSFFRFKCFRARLIASVAAACSCIAIGFAIYRAYLPSLGL
jgi:hypothetical protein